MLGFAPLTSVPLSSLPVATGRSATGFVTGGFGTPIAAYARTQTATGAAPSTTFGAVKFGVTVTATGAAPNTKLGAPPKFGPNILQIVGNGADGETTFADESPYYAALTRNGSIAKSTAQSRFGTGSISLTGASTANNLSLGASTLNNLGGGGLFTIEAQIYLNAYNASGGRLMSVTGGTTGWSSLPTGIQWTLDVTASGIQFNWILLGVRSPEGGSSSWWQRSMSAAVALSTWQHIEVSFDGTTMRLFVEGALVASSANSMELKATAGTLQIGAMYGEASGATYAANAYIQQIRIRRDCLYTAAFTPPAAGLPSWVGEVLPGGGIAPTTQIPNPRVRLGLPATTVGAVTQFGTAFGQNLQRPTGFQPTAVGDPRIFPYSPPPINSTQFGTGRLFPYHVAPGINGTQFGAPAGRQHWDVEWAPPKTRFGTPFITFNQTQIASGFTSGNFGTPLGMRVLPPNTGRICIAGGFDPVRIGSPSATWPRYGAASGIAAGHLGVPNGVRGQRASGINSTAVGVPAVKTMHKASGFASGQLGLAVEVMTQRAAGSQFVQMFGLPESDRGHSFKVYGINASGRIGSPTGFSRFNYRVTGFRPSAIGSATCHESHRVIHIMPMCRIGNPILKRNTQC